MYKMSADQLDTKKQGNICTMNVESVNRITKLPVVESTISTATSLYSKVKEFNGLTQWTLSTAECTVSKAVEIGKPYAAPVVTKLDGPLKKVDSLMCTGLDYLETNVPMVKLPPCEMYNNTKEYINVVVTPVSNVVTPAVQTAKSLVEPAVETAKSKYEEAKQMVEPAVQTARQIVEPYVQPALDKANAIKDYGSSKLDEFIHKERNTTIVEEEHSTSSDDDCEDSVKKTAPKKN